MKKNNLITTFIVLAALFATNSLAAGSIDINFGSWQLQQPFPAPNGQAQVISSSQLQSGYNNAYFYSSKNGAQVFMDPATGATTPGSLHPRSELREMSGNALAAWTGAGTNVLTFTGEVVKVGGGATGNTVIAQIHQSTSDAPLYEVIYSTAKGFEVMYENAQSQGHFAHMKYPYSLKTPYTIKLSVTNYVVQVKINHTVVFTQTIDPALQSATLYFKCGNYDQTAVSGPVSVVPYTIVKDYAINVIHLL